MAVKSHVTNGALGDVPPRLDVPPSNTTCEVKIIDVCTISNVSTKSLFTPAVPQFDTAPPSPSLVFLVEHPSGQKVLFDLGIRSDWDNLSPDIVQRVQASGYGVQVESGIADFLDAGGVGRDNIDAVIWSHAHWDHTGDPSTFPGKTVLVVGPGFKDHYLGQGQGNSPLGGVLPSDVEFVKGREVREITFDESDSSVLKIGQFRAFDYFHDGSMYLLDTPGHCVGHLCALVRTTADPATFVCLGGDAAHHCGEVRPSAYLPLPASITPNPLKERKVNAPPLCAKPWFEKLQTSRDRDPAGPLFQPAFGHDMNLVLDTIRKMQQYDGETNIMVILAHDSAFRAPVIPHFPKTINQWKASGLGDALRWKWISDVYYEDSDAKA